MRGHDARLLYPFFAAMLFVTATAASSMCVVRVWTVPVDSGARFAGDVEADDAGNVYALTVSQDHAVSVVKVGPAGNLLWATPPEPSSGVGGDERLAVDRAGNAYVTFGDQTAIVVVKYSPSGVQLWRARLEPDRGWTEWPRAIALDEANGAVYVAGQSATLPDVADGISRTVVISLYHDGRREWTRHYQRGDYLLTGGLEATPDGGVALASSGNGTTMVLKYDADGGLVWAQAAAFDVENPLIDVDAGGAVYAAGEDTVAKYAPSGTLVWSAPFPPAGEPSEPLRDFAADGAGNVYVVGTHSAASYAPNGQYRWSVRYEVVRSEALSEPLLALDAVGNAYVTRTIYDRYAAEPLPLRVVTVKYDSTDGAQRWLATYDEQPSSWSTAMSVDAGGNVFVLVWALERGTLGQATLIKYAQPGGP
jgi:outer membrane protein assembly factor BamB